MTRFDVLDTARGLVGGDRARDYGDVRESFGRTASLWSAHLGTSVSAHDVAVMMALLKVSRMTASFKGDNYVDGCGYLAIAGELATGSAA